VIIGGLLNGVVTYVLGRRREAWDGAVSARLLFDSVRLAEATCLLSAASGKRHHPILEHPSESVALAEDEQKKGRLSAGGTHSLAQRLLIRPKLCRYHSVAASLRLAAQVEPSVRDRLDRIGQLRRGASRHRSRGALT
jgi:hypothetical protein